jgi:hypothetical protein
VPEIAKPAGKLNRTAGFSLKDCLEMEDRLYSEIKVCTDVDHQVISSDGWLPKNYIESLVDKHFDPSKPHTKQSPACRKLVSEEASF